MAWSLGGNAKDAGNQGGDVENQDGNLGVAVESKIVHYEIVNMK